VLALLRSMLQACGAVTAAAGALLLRRPGSRSTLELRVPHPWLAGSLAYGAMRTAAMLSSTGQELAQHQLAAGP
jgi:hypothetical protein